MSVEEGSDGGKPFFRVTLARDLYDRRRTDRDIQIAGLIGACGMLPRSSLGTAGGIDGENATHPVALQLRARLEDAGVPDWTSEHFDPCACGNSARGIPGIGRRGGRLSAALNDLIDSERHDDWQASLIFETRNYRDPNSDEAVERRVSVAAAQSRLADAVGQGFLATAQYLFGVLGVRDEARALREVPHLPNPLTAGGNEPPAPPMRSRSWQNRYTSHSPPAQAAQPAIWTMCHAAWIGRGRPLGRI